MNQIKELLKKDIVIIGTGTFQDSFERVIENLNIIEYVDIDESKINTVCSGKVVKRLEYILELDISNILIIIASYKYDEISKKLDKIGLIKNLNYVNALDVLDYQVLLSTKVDLLSASIIIFGTGNCQKKFEEKYYFIDIECYVDNDISKQGTYHNKKLINNPSFILERDLSKTFVIVASQYYDDISQQLNEMGLKENENYVSYQYLLNLYNFLPSKMFLKTLNDNKKTNYFCNKPFNDFVVSIDGDIFCCCPEWLKVPIGNIRSKSVNDIWDSIIAKILRLSVWNGSYSFCDIEYCPFIKSSVIDGNSCVNVKENEDTKYSKMFMKTNPKKIDLLYDLTCNLKCVTCRKEYYALNGKSYERALEVQNELTKYSFVDLEVLNIANGDPFASRLHIDLLQNFNFSKSPKLIVNLVTNAILFNEKNWNKISNIHKQQVFVYVSIDAATKETYESIRVGGKFDILMENLYFISKLRKEEIIKNFKISFVVQQKNYKEMKKFVELGQSLSVDKVVFTKLQNWGTFTEEEFSQLAINQNNNFEYDNFIDLLQDPIFKHPIVSFMNLDDLYQEVNK